MQKILTPAERLIVAADFKPALGNPSRMVKKDWVRYEVLKLADELQGTGVYLKVNSALRTCGYGLINEIQERSLKVFADAKLYDIGETCGTDGVFLSETKPELLTVACIAGVAAMKALKAELPETEVLGVTVLTSLTDADAQDIFGCDVETAVLRLAAQAVTAGINGFICSPVEARLILEKVIGAKSMTINTPNIRPAWAEVKADDQNQKRSRTPKEAIKDGATRIIIGRPILQAVNRRDAVMQTIGEIGSA